MSRRKKLVAVSAAIAVPLGLGLAGTAYAQSTPDPTTPSTVSESTEQAGPQHEHGPGHRPPEGVEHGPGHQHPDGVDES